MANILGMGNPLLDISAVVDADFLAKYGLKNADQILAEEKHVPMYEELSAKPDVQNFPGGATQNSIRVAQWLLGAPCTSYMGCVGKDSYADKMKAVMDGEGIKAHYLVDEATPTGTCGVCVVDSDRSLVANLAAANNYKATHLQEPENMALLEAAGIVYSAGFFITVSPEAIKMCSDHCNAAADKVYCMNLSAPFIMQVPPFLACLKETMPKIDVLFGNETETATFAEAMGWETKCLKEIAEKIAALPKENGADHKHKHRTVIITQGADETIIVNDGKTEVFPIVKLAKEQLVDTNGAGDAYVGGVLASMSKGGSPADWAKAGAYAASVIVQRSGCSFPEKPEITV